LERKNIRCLVTGTTGFIGNHLASILDDLGHDVYALERYVTTRFVLGKRRQLKTLFADLTDYFAIKRLVETVKPEIVFHLAALSPVAYSYDRPMEVLDTNFMATVNLAEACMRRDNNLRHFLFAGTSEEYGNQTKFPIKETARLKPNSPYAVSKVAADKYLRYMWDTYKFPVTIIRPFNTYGRINNTHFVVERIITQMLHNKVVKLGDPDPTRDFMYVVDHVKAYLTCMNNKAAKGQAFNFCTGRDISIRRLTEIIAEETEFNNEIVWHTIPKRPQDIQRLVGDNSKAWKRLGWKPVVSLEKGIELTIEKLKEKER